jgi:hypothetical protein
MQSITDVLEEHPQVNRVRANLQTGSILIHHDREDGSLESVFATLADIGMIVGGIAANEIPEPESHSEAASSVADAIADLDQRVHQATNGLVDLRFLFPLGLALLAIRQLRVKGLQLDIVPWYVLAWYAFDSFMKLHYTRSLPPPAKKALSG